MTFISRSDDLAVEKAITALCLAPSPADAVEIMRADGYQCNETTLLGLVAHGEIADRFLARREELAATKERMVAADLLDNTELGTQVVRMALRRTLEKLEADTVDDPSRVARDVSQVVSQQVEKRLALQGRPTQITEVRDVSEIVRALAGMKVVQVIDSTAVEEDADE